MIALHETSETHFRDEMRHIYHANFWFALNWLRDPLFLPPNVYITIQVSNYDYDVIVMAI